MLDKLQGSQMMDPNDGNYGTIASNLTADGHSIDIEISENSLNAENLQIMKECRKSSTPDIYKIAKLRSHSQTVMLTNNVLKSQKYTYYSAIKYLIFCSIICVYTMIIPPTCSNGKHRIFPLWFFGMIAFILAILTIFVMYYHSFKCGLAAPIHWLVYNMAVSYYLLYAQFKVYQFTEDNDTNKCKNELLPIDPDGVLSIIDILVFCMIFIWLTRILLNTIRCHNCNENHCLVYLRTKFMYYVMIFIWSGLVILVIYCLIREDFYDDRVPVPIGLFIFQLIILFTGFDALWLPTVRNKFLKACACCMDNDLREHIQYTHASYSEN